MQYLQSLLRMIMHFLGNNNTILDNLKNKWCYKNLRANGAWCNSFNLKMFLGVQSEWSPPPLVLVHSRPMSHPDHVYNFYFIYHPMSSNISKPVRKALGCESCLIFLNLLSMLVLLGLSGHDCALLCFAGLYRALFSLTQLSKIQQIYICLPFCTSENWNVQIQIKFSCSTCAGCVAAVQI